MEDNLRAEILERIASSRKNNWTGGFEPDFLADFLVNRIKDATTN